MDNQFRNFDRFSRYSDDLKDITVNRNRYVFYKYTQTKEKQGNKNKWKFDFIIYSLAAFSLVCFIVSFVNFIYWANC